MGRRRASGRNVTGILVLDKPTGRGSNESLQIVKRLFRARKAGHTGSLDKLASGVRHDGPIQTSATRLPLTHDDGLRRAIARDSPRR